MGGFLLSAINPENGTVTYTYNSNGLVASKTDAKGQAFTYQYDSYNRLQKIFVGGALLRTLYDTNSLDGSFTTYGARGSWWPCRTLSSLQDRAIRPSSRKCTATQSPVNPTKSACRPI